MCWVLEESWGMGGGAAVGLNGSVERAARWSLTLLCARIFASRLGGENPFGRRAAATRTAAGSAWWQGVGWTFSAGQGAGRCWAAPGNGRMGPAAPQGAFVSGFCLGGGRSVAIAKPRSTARPPPRLGCCRNRGPAAAMVGPGCGSPAAAVGRNRGRHDRLCRASRLTETAGRHRRGRGSVASSALAYPCAVVDHGALSFTASPPSGERGTGRLPGGRGPHRRAVPVLPGSSRPPHRGWGPERRTGHGGWAQPARLASGLSPVPGKALVGDVAQALGERAWSVRAEREIFRGKEEIKAVRGEEEAMTTGVLQFTEIICVRRWLNL